MEKIKLLIIEDNSLDKRIIEEYLSEAADISFEFHHAFRLKEAFNLLEIADFDVVTLDLGLPDSHGLETFKTFHHKYPQVPTIVVSGYEDPDIAKTVIDNGAHGYIVKGKFSEDSLLKEIKTAMNKQTFRSQFSSKLAPSNSQGEKAPSISKDPVKNQELKQEKSLIQIEPDILEELVSEYLQLLKSSIGGGDEGARTNIKVFFETNNEAFQILNLKQKDFEELHKQATSKLNLSKLEYLNKKSFLDRFLDEVKMNVS